jgi:hypothetical protein
VITYKKVTTLWFTPESRLLGQVILAPPIAIGAGLERYTRDWAIIEMEASKFDLDNFMGNAIDLGTELTRGQFTRKMYPRPTNPHSFKYLKDRLLRLQRVMTDNEMQHPVDEDTDGDPCRIVIKRSNTTELTFGHATTVAAYSRYYVASIEGISKEWSVLPYDKLSAPSRTGATLDLWVPMAADASWASSLAVPAPWTPPTSRMSPRPLDYSRTLPITASISPTSPQPSPSPSRRPTRICW